MPAASLDRLADALVETGLLEPEQLAELTSQLRPRFPEPRSLARELVRRGWLTPFQVNRLAQGAGQNLVLGPYVLLERLGEGGMGQVFKARHRLMNRLVAVKVIRPDRLAGPETVARFRREIQAAARLSHPHIVLAHDAAQVGETHLFVMEYVEGTDLARLLQQHGQLPVSQACEYARQAALGLQHAHEQGLVHRDIKPANLLMAARGTMVKVADLGLARLHHDDSPQASSHLTGEGEVMGTPDYIAPEQALDTHRADIRADIYSLGCTLYHLLTGKPPFPGGTFTAKVIKHREIDPVPAEALRPEVPRNLGAVLRRMMAKRPEDRYQTPAEVAAALEPFCGKGPESDWVTALAGPSVLPETGPGESLKSTGRGKMTKEMAPAATRQAREGPPALPDASRSAPRPGGRPRRRILGLAAVGLLLVVLPIVYLFGPAVIRIATNKGQLVIQTDRDVEVTLKQGGQVVRVIDTRTNRTYDITAGDYEMEIVEVPDGLRTPTKHFQLTRGGQKVVDVRLELAEVKPPPEDRKIPEPKPWPVGSSPFDALKREDIPAYELAVAGDGDPRKAPAELVAILGDSRLRHSTMVSAVAYSPDGKRLASASCDGTVRVWDAETGRAVFTFRDHNWSTSGFANFFDLAFSPDGKLLASTCGDQKARVRDLTTGKEVQAQGNQKHHVGVLAFSPDGQYLAGGWQAVLSVWEVATGKDLWTINTKHGRIAAMAISPDGRVIATGGKDKTVHIWDWKTGLELANLPGHTEQVTGLAFSPDGKYLASSALRDPDFRVWEVGTWKLHHTLKAPSTANRHIAFSPDGQWLGGTVLNQVPVWGTSSWKPKANVQVDSWEQLFDLDFHSNGKRLAVASIEGSVRVLDLETGKELLPGRGSFGFTDLAFPPDGKYLTMVGAEFQDRARVLKVQAWDPTTKQTTPQPVRGPTGALIAWVFPSSILSPDGGRVASIGNGFKISVWDVASGAKLAEFKDDNVPQNQMPSIFTQVFCLDGKRVACAARDQTVRAWDIDGNRQVFFLKAASGVNTVALSPNGKTLASSHVDKKVQVWDVASNQMLYQLDSLVPVVDLTYSPDGRYLLGAGFQGSVKDLVDLEGTIQVWEAATGKPSLTLKEPKHPCRHVSFSPDGALLASADPDGRVIVWKVGSGEKRIEWQLPVWVQGVVFAPDGRHLATRNGNATVYILRMPPAKG